MNKRLLGTASLYSASVLLAAYLASGQSAAAHVTYTVTALFATHMSQRGNISSGATVSRIPESGAAGDDDMVAVMAHVEELLSTAS
jgi:hypothetical protein